MTFLMVRPLILLSFYKYSGTDPDFSNPQFFEYSDNSNQKSFTSFSVEHCN